MVSSRPAGHVVDSVINQGISVDNRCSTFHLPVTVRYHQRPLSVFSWVARVGEPPLRGLPEIGHEPTTGPAPRAGALTATGGHTQ